jgi:hypothetical protein
MLGIPTTTKTDQVDLLSYPTCRLKGAYHSRERRNVSSHLGEPKNGSLDPCRAQAQTPFRAHRNSLQMVPTPCGVPLTCFNPPLYPVNGLLSNADLKELSTSCQPSGLPSTPLLAGKSSQLRERRPKLKLNLQQLNVSLQVHKWIRLCFWQVETAFQRLPPLSAPLPQLDDHPSADGIAQFT